MKSHLHLSKAKLAYSEKKKVTYIDKSLSLQWEEQDSFWHYLDLDIQETFIFLFIYFGK